IARNYNTLWEVRTAMFLPPLFSAKIFRPTATIVCRIPFCNHNKSAPTAQASIIPANKKQK
ncbi:hypothetical protein ABTN07_20135, partial [Acinetobacter baumannii]